jgi:formylmethanofuran dehydrogenase subunit E
LALRLLKFKTETEGYNNMWQTSYRFAVVDPNKSHSYPSNFVCMLPKKLEEGSEFVKMFGEKSVEQAQQLLKDSIKKERTAEVKTELQKRLKLLELKQNIEIKCSLCGKEFVLQRARRYKRNYCSECVQKRYGTR